MIRAGATPRTFATISRTSSNVTVPPAMRTSSGTDAATPVSESVERIARRATARPMSRSEVKETRCAGEPYAVNSLFAMSKPTVELARLAPALRHDVQEDLDLRTGWPIASSKKRLV